MMEFWDNTQDHKDDILNLSMVENNIIFMAPQSRLEILKSTLMLLF